MNNKIDNSNTAEITKQHQNYWRANLRLMAKLLLIWFSVSFGLGIVMADWLDQFSIAGFKLGFWFAQQGAIYVFVLLIFVYARQMKILDREYGVDDKANQLAEDESSKRLDS